MANINKPFRKYISLERLLAATSLAILVILSLIHPLSAQSVAQGYNADQTLQRGMLVAVKGDDPNKVEAVTPDSLDKLKGVVVQANDTPVTISNEGQKVFVSTAGTYDVLVSDQGGQIGVGDYISISSLPGIGMKATDTERTIVGRAVSGFKGQGDSIGSSVLENSNQRKVNLGRIQVSISVSRNPLLKAPETPKVPEFLDKLSQTVANKPVSPIKIYMAVTVFIAAAAISGIMLYSGARSSLISVGRNPLSRKSLLRGLLQVVILSLIIFITGIFGVYLLLKL